MNIAIPHEALEAGAAVVQELRFSTTELAFADDIARAAFTAMVEAWPGMERYSFPENGFGDDYAPALDEIILPLPQEKPDGE